MDQTRYLIIASMIFLILFSLRLLSIGGFHGIYTDIAVENLGLAFKDTRLNISKDIKTFLPEDQAILLSGILLGQKDDLSAELKKTLIASSTIHIVVVSGQNLSLFVGFLMTLAPYFGRRKVAIISIFAIIFYSILTGLQIPVLRAAIMSTIALIGQLTGHERQTWWILILTAGLMLLFEPNWLFSISFQLSFLATIGSVVCAKYLIPILKFLPPFFREDAAVSIATQALTIPVIATNFGSISLIGIFANTMVLWTIPFVMVSGFILLCTNLISPILASYLALIPYSLITYFIYIIQFFVLIPFSTIKTPLFHPIFWIGYYILLFGVISILAKKSPYNSQNLSEYRYKYL